MAKASKMDILNTPEMVSKILDKVRQGSYDKDIYKALKVSNVTFLEWKKIHQSEYDEARADRLHNVLEYAEVGLQKKLLGGVSTETVKKYKYTDDGGKILVGEEVKTKDIQPDTIAIMFALKAADPKRWDYINAKKLEVEGDGISEIKEISLHLNGYNIDNFKESADEVHE